jgi:hypothetical protein
MQQTIDSVVNSQETVVEVKKEKKSRLLLLSHDDNPNYIMLKDGKFPYLPVPLYHNLSDRWYDNTIFQSLTFYHSS